MASTHQNPTITISILAPFLILLSSYCASQPLHSQPLISPTPSPPAAISQSSPSDTNNHARAPLKPILFGILLGTLSGFLLALLFLYLIRLAFLYTHLTPLLKGPVVFTPQINPKSLLLALVSNPQSPQLTPIPSASPACKYLKLQLETDLSVAIKVVPLRPNSNSTSEKRKIQQKLESLSRLKHRNVLTLRAYLLDKDKLFIAYDFLSEGSLEDLMKRVRAGQMVLNWEVRSKIALGIAKGMRYLHFECNPRLMHWNLKPTNVILDEEFEPRLGDCGLVRISVDSEGDLQFGDQRHSSFFLAPECNQGCSRDGLVCWLRQKQQAGEAKEALDTSILGDEGEEEEMLMAMRIALVCLSDLPADRPSSDELVSMLSQLHSF
ncbi:inactive leucine-rich repeat receptor-like protein kinase CORYNE-like protein [Carex littledalei]|uniref:Inactive leucine-rich repeat receptor-like protein kinase CORYNE-like protein n=1 Tax=Carex littledalei TaxID=544730 RepID=A0A833RCF8_9POAL|nr:inactive leucine-rich repeat receptor-like protein kinase CORYNE-like protein [Carex littledalei]